MKKYFVEVTVGIYMDEMDDENNRESITELAEGLVAESISQYWNADIVTGVSECIELRDEWTSDSALDAYTSGTLY